MSRFLLHGEIIKVGYKFKASQLFYSNCCLDTHSAQGVEADVVGDGPGLFLAVSKEGPTINDKIAASGR